MSYQGTIQNGEIVSPGERECETRYEALRPVLDRYTRRFTALDFGADAGYFGLRMAREYGAAVVMVEGGPQLLETCNREQPEHAIALQKRFSVEDLEELAACEHFDVALFLNVLHHFGGDWERATFSALAMADRVVIETPTPEDSGACGQEAIPGIYVMLQERDHLTLGETPSHTSETLRPIWLFERGKDRLTKTYAGATGDEAKADVHVQSNDAWKSVYIPRKGERRRWIDGINLQTYLEHGGIYPPREQVARQVSEYELPESRHGDVRPWNFVFDGQRLKLIDGRDERANFDDDEGLRMTEGAVMGERQAFEDVAERPKQLVVLTPFRNARKHLTRYFRQLTALRNALAPSIRLRLVAAEGDSKDGTRQAILDKAHEANIPVDLVPTDHGGIAWKSVEDPDRMRTMSNVMNAALSAVEPTDDLVLWIMSDLGWEASTIRDLVLAADEKRDGFDVLSPLVFQRGNFYDTWAYRAKGSRFRATPPHHETLIPGELSEVESAGTCLAMRAEVARSARATNEEAVSWCADARRHGARVAVSDRWKVEHDPPQPRKLLWLGDAVAPTGFARCTHGVVPVLQEAGWEVTVIGVNYWGIPHDYPYRIWPAAVGPNAPFGERQLAYLLSQNEYDAVVLLTDPWHVPTYLKHAESARPDGDVPPVLGWLACDSKNQKGEDLEGLSMLATWTEFADRELQEGGYGGPSRIVPLAIDHRVFEPLDQKLARRAVLPDALPEDAFLVGFVGRNQRRKRIDLLISYFAEWIRRHEVEDAYLYIQAAPTGSAAGCDIKSLVRYYGLQDKVLANETANATEQQMVAMYSALDAYLTTTMAEGWALPVAEAMACGTPCIVPDSSGLGSWIGDAALKVQCATEAPVAPLNAAPWTVGSIPDQDATVEALQRLYSDAGLRQEYRERGIRRVAELSWQRSGELMAEALDAMLASTHPEVQRALLESASDFDAGLRIDEDSGEDTGDG